MIHRLVKVCIELEAERGIAKLTLKELSRYLYESADYCRQNLISECFKLINAFDTDTDLGFRNYMMLVVLWCTGLRSAELCALKWADIDLDQGSLLVAKGKGGKQRLLFLNDRLWEDMRRYHQTQSEHVVHCPGHFRCLLAEMGCQAQGETDAFLPTHGP